MNSEIPKPFLDKKSLMKKNAAILLITGATALSASAGIVYVDVNNLVIPNDFEGVYVNVITGAVEYDVSLEDFNAGPWINLYEGGTGIATSDLLLPWTNQSTNYDGGVEGSYFVNVSLGSDIGASGVIDPVDGALIGAFTSEESVSVFHIGMDDYQFVSGSRGYLAFAYSDSSIGPGTAYGWFSFTPTVGGPGLTFDFARSDTPGESLSVGAVPEPASAALLLGVCGLGVAALRRRRA